VSLTCGGLLILLLALEGEVPDHDGLSEPLTKSGRLAQSNNVAKSGPPSGQSVKVPNLGDVKVAAPGNAAQATAAAPSVAPAEPPRPPQPEPAEAPASPPVPAVSPPPPAQPLAVAATPDPLSLKPPARRELDRALAPLLSYTISA
jgi:hypothetical protein